MATDIRLQPATTYSQWVRQVIALMQANQHDQLISLFESSVTEPVELLSTLVGSSFADPVTSRYASAFGDGNPWVTAQLAKDYDVGEEQVVCTTGATSALSLIYRALLKPGDRVLVENPGFDLFGILARSQGFGVDTFERIGPRFTVDPEAVERAIGRDTRIVVISDLHNPTGHSLPPETLTALGEIADRRMVTIVVDEVYSPYVGSDVRAAASAGISPRILSVNSLTKIYGLSTLRCGWIVGDASLKIPIRALSHEIDFGISKLSHAVAALVLEDPKPFRDRTKAIISRTRPIVELYHQSLLADGLIEGELPDHGCIAFLRLPGIDDTKRFSGWLAQECGTVVVPGEYFGAPGHIRIGFGIEPDALELGLQMLTKGLTKYQDGRFGRDGAKATA